MVTVGGLQAGHFVSVLKNGDNLGLTHLEYAYQEGEGGIPAAIALAEKFAADGSICVILGDNTTDADISSAVRNFNGGSVAFFKEVPDPERYGVPVFDQKDKTKLFESKKNPKNPNQTMPPPVFIFLTINVLILSETANHLLGESWRYLTSKTSISTEANSNGKC